MTRHAELERALFADDIPHELELTEAEARSVSLAITKASTPQYILDELDGADEDGDQFEEELETYGDELPAARVEAAAKTGSQWLMEQAVNLTALGIVAHTFWQPKLKATASDRARAYVDPDEWPKDLPPFGGGAQPGLGPRRGELTLRFNQLDARAGEWASRHSGQLVTHIQDSEKDRIAELIGRANTQGLPVGTVAKQLRWVGLLPHHQTAVARYQQELAAEGRPMPQVLRMADKYKRSLLNYRTRMIARQELLTATHQGQLQAILYAVQHGEIDPSRTQRVWVVADDERLCPICAYMDGQETDADEPWTLEDGTSVMIPQEAHIQCRCSWQLVTTPREDDVEAASLDGMVTKYSEDQPRDEQGQWTDVGSGRAYATTPTREFYDYNEGPRWVGLIAQSGLPKDFPKKLYNKFDDVQGQGPCGVMAEINRRDKGFKIAACGAKPQGKPDTMNNWFPHYVNLDERGAIVDETNPFGKVLEYQSVYVIPSDELPELVDEDNIAFLRNLTMRNGK